RHLLRAAALAVVLVPDLAALADLHDGPGNECRPLHPRNRDAIGGRLLLTVANLRAVDFRRVDGAANCSADSHAELCARRAAEVRAYSATDDCADLLATHGRYTSK